MERIGISVELFGAERAEEHLKELDGYVKRLNGKKLRIAVDNKLKEMEADLRRVQNAKINIRMNKNRDMARFREELNKLTSQKHRVQVDITQAKEQIRQLEKQLSGKALQNATKQWTNQIKDAQLKMRQIQDQINATNDAKAYSSEKFDAQFRKAEEGASRLKMAMQEIKNMDITPRFNFGQLQARVKSLMYQVGSGMQSIGNGLARITAPIDTLLRGTAYAAIFKGLNTVTEGLGGSFERYDIMHTYPKIMHSMGESTESAKKAVNELYESVLGLPTGLDTIVEAQKQYYLATNNMAKATKVAIAANNAFVAGGADDVQILQGQRQLRDLMSAGKLRISEWESLAKAMPGAFKAIQDELHVTRADIMSGKVSADQFVNALLKIGTGTGVVARAAEQMKHTFTAVGANIRNALRNAGMETIEELDKMFMDYNGGDVIDQLLKIKPAIVSIKDSVKDWVRANPDKIINFLERVQKIDFKGFAKGIIEGFSTMGKIALKIGELFTSIGGENVGKWIVYMNMMSKVLRGFGGIVRGSGGIVSYAVSGTALLFKRLFDFIKSTNTAARMANIGAVQKLKSFFAKSKGVTKAAESAGALTTTSTSLAKTGEATATMATSFKQIGANLLKMVTPAITAATYIGTIWLGVKAIADIGKTKINWNKTVENLVGAGVALTAMSTFMKGLSSIGLLGSNVASLGKSAIGSVEVLLSSGVFAAVAKLMEVISSAKIGTIGDIQYKLGSMMLAISEMTAFMMGLGAVTVTPAGILQVLGDLSAVFTAGAWFAVTKALERIGTLKVPSTDKIRSIAKVFNTLRSSLLNKGIWQSFKDSWEASDLKDIAKDLEEATSSITRLLNNLNNATKQITQLGKNKVDVAAVDTAVTNINQSSGAFKKIFDAIQSFWGRNAEGTGGARFGGASGVNIPSPDKIDEYANVISSTISALQKLTQLPQKLSAIKSSFATLFNSYGSGKGHNKFIDTTAIQNDIQMIVGLVDSITGATALGKLQAATDRMQGVNLDNIIAQMQKIPQVMKTLSQLKNSISGQGWLSAVDQTPEFALPSLGSGLGTGGITQKNVYGEEVTGMLDTIRQMVDVVVKIGDELNRVPDISSNADMLKQAIVKVTSALNSLSGLKGAAETAQGANISGIASMIASYISQINNALIAAPMMLANAGMFATGVKLIQSSLASITSGGGGSIASFIAGLNRIPGALQAVSAAMQGKGKQWKEQLVSGFKGTAEKIKAEINKIKSAISGVSFYNAGYSAGSSWASGFNAGAAKAHTPSVGGGGGNALANGVKSLFGFSTGGRVARNGVQYRSLGGKIFRFVPKGTDRVPAMLTPGEYVMNKRATKTYGPAFMQRLNHLDIKGALASLYMRGGQLAYATPTVNIDKSTHNTYNNQQVHLTNNNASQGYQESRASRYIRKL